MKKKFKLEKKVKIGIFAVAMILMLYWAINFIKGTDLIQGTNTYFATYDQVNGLQPSSQIVIKGYKVGVIRKMIFDPSNSNKIVVEFRIKSKFKIPDNSKARIYSDGLMGGKAIEIEMGDSPKYLHNGDTLRSQWDKDLLEIAGSELEFIKVKANALVNEMMSVLKGLNNLIVDNSQNITTTLGNIASLSGSLDHVVSSESENLKGIIRNLNSLSKNLNESSPKINSMLTNMDEFSGSLNSEKMKGSINELSESLAELNGIIEGLNKGDGTAGKLLKDDGLYDSLTMASGSLTRLLEDLKSNPKRYVHFSLFGGGNKDKKEKAEKKQSVEPAKK